MNFILVAAVLIALLLLWAVIALVRKAVKWAFILGLIALVFYLFTSGVIGADQKKFVESINEERQLVILEDKVAFLTNPVVYVSPSDAPPASRTIRVSLEALDFDIKINNKKITSGELKAFYAQGVPLSSIAYADIALDSRFPKEGTLEQGVFAYVYDKELQPLKNPLKFSERYKQGTITVEPETAFFKAAKFFPAEWIEQKLNKAIEGVETITANAVTEVKKWVSSAS